MMYDHSRNVRHLWETIVLYFVTQYFEVNVELERGVTAYTLTLTLSRPRERELRFRLALS